MPHVIQDTVLKDGTGTPLARVVGGDGEPIVQADIASATYTAYLLDADDQTQRTAIAEHIAVSLVVADLVYNTLQTEFLPGILRHLTSFSCVRRPIAEEAIARFG